MLSWTRDFQTVHSGSLTNGDNSWFVEGQLNACYNCVDRHAFEDPDRVAIIYEADEPDDGRNVTYGEPPGCSSRWEYAKATQLRSTFP
jgi:acetyl-CoA synthetase